ncbi:NUDIX domain-containing protein [Altericroceibacterium spongiae]|uniref:NUDIX domain-containing protein n=1 Tax=Altericroceibacterium spongiae TaxID=2320269 RepID=A0A420EM94_9SPHN|nr:NUDIX domain-containing protein [Altericroceibacterium spongiae]RKF21801.1 NUDIX domain-containing protein [Altericroceibacterium spongiae]
MQRPSSRLLVLDKKLRLLLFRFEHKKGPLSGRIFWATPGGGLEDGESYEDAARRELFEEAGLKVEHIGPQIANRAAAFALPSGQMVEADERYFAIAAGQHAVSMQNQTELEREIMTAHRWWSQQDLRNTNEQVWPEDLADILINAGLWTPAS